MTNPRHILAFLTAAFCALTAAAASTNQPEWIVEALSPEGWFDYDPVSGIAHGTNGLVVKYGGAVLTAERVTLNQQTGEAEADGRVRILRENQVWVSEHLRYNFKTRQMRAEQFRTGRAPVFAQGQALEGDVSNRVFTARNAYVTTDDVSEPFVRIRASRLRIVPGESVEARDAVLYVGGVPAFYFPYYRRSLAPRANHFTFVPGYRSRFGPYLLSAYNWFWGEALDGALHLDYRLKRGPAGGPDVNVHLGRWGELALKYYYLYDEEPDTRGGFQPPHNRHRFGLGYDATPFTNLNLKAAVAYQSDPTLLRDFFEGDHRRNPQPRTFLEVNRLWDNFSLDVFAEPRVNDFYETVERLPEVRLTAFRQQLGNTPLFYESESTAGWYQRRFAEITNSFPGTNRFAAGRADTWHQITLPQTLFGWLQVAPRVGGRFTWYGDASGPGAITHEEYRGVFNTGVEFTFKASRFWPQAQSRFLEIHGLRHILEPSLNYVFVPRPHPAPPRLPQFDTEWPSLRLLPIEYPDYNAVDAIDSQNVLRLGLRQRLQTKRDGHIENLLNWDVYTDWRLDPRSDQSTFADLYSDLVLRPRRWLTLESQTRYDTDRGQFNLAFHHLTLQPQEAWSLGLGHWYLRDDFSPRPTALGQGNNRFIATFYYRLNENWAFRTTQHFEARDGRWEEQFYTIYRDFRSWTGALTFRVRDNRTGADDYTVAFTLSLKARPRFGLGEDAVQPERLLGN